MALVLQLASFLLDWPPGAADATWVTGPVTSFSQAQPNQQEVQLPRAVAAVPVLVSSAVGGEPRHIWATVFGSDVV